MAKPSAIETELLKATGLASKSKESRQAYLKRLVEAVEELPQETWAQLSKPAQDWTNAGINALPAMPKEPSEDASKEAKAEYKKDMRTYKEEYSLAEIPDFEPETSTAAADADTSRKEAKKEKSNEPQKEDKDMANKKGKGAAAKAPKEKSETKRAKANGSGDKRNKLQTIMGVVFTPKSAKLKSGELMPKIRDKGIDTSESTITTVRSDGNRVSRYWHKQGWQALKEYVEALDAE